MSSTRPRRSRDVKPDSGQPAPEKREHAATFNLRFALTAASVALALGVLGNLLAAGLQQTLIGNQFTWELVMAIALATIGVMVVGVFLERRRHEVARPASFFDEALRRMGESPEQMSFVEKLGKYLMYGLHQLRGRSLISAMQIFAVFALMILLAWQLAEMTEIAAQSLPLAICLAWLAMAAIPFAVALVIGSQELTFRRTLQPVQRRGLTVEKFFGAYVSAFIGQMLALVALLILDAYTGLWPAFSTFARFIFWLIAGCITLFLCLAGTAVAVTLWRNLVKEDRDVVRPWAGTLMLAIAFPFFVYPALAAFGVFALPLVRSPVFGAIALITAVFALGRQMQND